MSKRGPGLGILLGATVVVVTAAFFLAALAPREAQLHALQAGGYAPWPESNPADDVAWLTNHTVWPSASIWIDFAPGRRLGFAFTDTPWVWAATASTCALLAGMVAARFAWRPNFDGYGAPLGLFCLFTFLGVAAVLQPLLRHGTLGFMLDLSANTITVVDRHSTTTLPLSAPVTLGLRPMQVRCAMANYGDNMCPYEVGELTTAAGQTASYFLLSDTQQARDIESAVLSFLNSGGQRLD